MINTRILFTIFAASDTPTEHRPAIINTKFINTRILFIIFAASDASTADRPAMNLAVANEGKAALDYH